jgi:hypothetical protein
VEASSPLQPLNTPPPHPSTLTLNPLSTPLNTPPPTPPPSALTDALVYLTQRTAQDLQLLPFGDWDKKSLRSDVPQKTMYGGVESNQKFLLRNATCAWARNASLAAGGRCPTDVSQMCGMDFSSWDKVREGYAKTVTEVGGRAGCLGLAFF